MNTYPDTITSSSPPRRRSRPMQAVALTTLTAFLAATIGCADRSGPEVEVHNGDISIRSEVLKDGAYVDAFTEIMPFADVPGWDREITVDGVNTTDLGLLRGASLVSIKLNTTETLTLRAVGEGDVFEIEGATPRNGEPRLTAMRLNEGTVEFFINGSSWATAKAELVIHLDGIAGDQRQVALDRLAMYALIASAEDSPQIAWPAVVLILGGAWLVICGGALGACAYSCRNCSGYKFQCFGFSLENKAGDWTVHVGGLAGCECIKPCPET